ncbi:MULTISPECIES: hypothetical protein [unclassified Sphingomonas]|uniref:hypothetical protein n=1 Tax=unclassified Sphingomonas TaxID=196159 RepID=UPI0012E366CE|nr:MULTISPECIES: hypothetical protein [unclassified Sphingomonas]
MSCRPFAVMLGGALAIAGCATHAGRPDPVEPLTLDLTRTAEREVMARYRLRAPTTALHFPQALGGYRADAWRAAEPGFRWVDEGNGERVERVDGRPFRTVAFAIAIDYRALPKSYAPFSPFSQGGALVHSGQFHACLAAPCEQPAPLSVRVDAPGATIGVEGRRTPARERFVSRDEGTNIFIGTLQPVDADGFVAIIDPGLPPATRQHLDRSLPDAIRGFAAIYGPLYFKPELYVSIDDTPEKNGRISTQGGTLPRQIFMHFDGENARERVAAGDTLWLDWFFAHEAAHLFQQDKFGKLVGDDQVGWMHEGGADALAALAMAARGPAARAYVLSREQAAEKACADGVAVTALPKAKGEGKFDLHYQCGLIIWLALDQALRRGGKDGLHDLNRALFAAVRGGQPWGEPLLFETARQLGVAPPLLAQIARLTQGSSTDAVDAVAMLGPVGAQSLQP